MITSEEFVVKVRADTSTMSKSTKELSKQLEKLTKQSSSFGDAFSQALNASIISNNMKGVEDTANKYEKIIHELDTEILKFSSKNAKRLSALNTLFNNTGMDESAKDFMLEISEVKPKQMEQFVNSGGGSIFTMYKNKYQALIEANKWMNEKANNLSTYKNQDTPYAKEQAAKLNREMETTNELMTKKYGSKWTKLRKAEFPQDILAKYGKKQDEVNKKQDGFFKRSWQIIKTVFIWNTLRKALQSVITMFNNGIKNAYQYSKKTKGLLADVLDDFNSKKTALGNAMGAFWANFIVAFKPYMTYVLKWVATVFNKLSKLVADIFELPEYLTANLDIFAEWQSCIKDTKELINGFDELNIFNSDGDNTEIKDMFTTVNRTDTEYKSVWQNIKDLWDKTIKAWCVKAWVTVKSWCVIAWQTVKQWISTAWTKFKSWFTDTLLPMIDRWWNGYTIYSTDEETGETWITEKEVGMWGKITNWFSDTFTYLKEYLFGNKDNGKQGIWQKEVVPFLEGLLTKIKNWYDTTFKPGLVSLFEYVVSQIKNKTSEKFEAWFKKVLTGTTPKEMTQAEYSSKYGVVDTGNAFKDFFKNFFRNYAPSGTKVVPNATGGVYTSPTLGLVGEYSGASNNPEIISPQSLMLDTMNQSNGQVVNTLIQCCRQLINTIDNKNLEVSIGDNVIASACAKGNNNYNKMTGKSLF